MVDHLLRRGYGKSCVTQIRQGGILNGYECILHRADLEMRMAYNLLRDEKKIKMAKNIVKRMMTSETKNVIYI